MAITQEMYEALVTRLEELEEEVSQLKTKARGGPKSDTPMNEMHAFRVRFGDLKDASHKDAAKELGLSYGQVFSCRGGYTFKTVKAGWKPSDMEGEQQQSTDA